MNNEGIDKNPSNLNRDRGFQINSICGNYSTRKIWIFFDTMIEQRCVHCFMI